MTVLVDQIAVGYRADAVTGPSGAGKTTLLSAMAGLLRPAQGAVTVAGVPLRDRDHAVRVLGLLRAEADRGAAVVFATHHPEAAAACDAELHLRDGRAELG